MRHDLQAKLHAGEFVRQGFAGLVYASVAFSSGERVVAQGGRDAARRRSSGAAQPAERSTTHICTSGRRSPRSPTQIRTPNRGSPRSSTWICIPDRRSPRSRPRSASRSAFRLGRRARRRRSSTENFFRPPTPINSKSLRRPRPSDRAAPLDSVLAHRCAFSPMVALVPPPPFEPHLYTRALDQEADGGWGNLRSRPRRRGGAAQRRRSRPQRRRRSPLCPLSR